MFYYDPVLILHSNIIKNSVKPIRQSTLVARGRQIVASLTSEAGNFIINLAKFSIGVK